MTESTFPPLRGPEPTLRHLFIKKKAERLKYHGRGGNTPKLREIERRQHSQMLEQQLRILDQEFEIVQQSILLYTQITLHVPFGGLVYLERKVEQFAQQSGTTGFSYLLNITRIARAAFDALWTDSSPIPKDTHMHCKYSSRSLSLRSL